jgi:hypothetical protein
MYQKHHLELNEQVSWTLYIATQNPSPSYGNNQEESNQIV